MKRRRVDNQIERRLLTAMITSTDFLAQASFLLQGNLDMIESSHWKTVAGWCIDHFTKYRQAPGKNIETTYHAWAEGQEDSPQAEAVHSLLEDLSACWEDAGQEPLNVPFMMDQLKWLVDKKSLNKLQENMEWALSTGKPKEAWNAIANCRPTDVLADTGVDPLRDSEAWERAFAESSEPLIHFPGDAGKFLNRALTRDALIGIQGPEKRGKTFWCIEMVMRALSERRKTAFFQVGDLTEGQVLRRIGTYLTGRPSLENMCGDVTVPTRVIPPREEGEELRVETRMKSCPRPVSEQACKRAIQKFLRAQGIHPDKPYFKLSVHANSSVSVQGVAAILARWELVDGFIPDVVVIDYADILAPEDPRMQPRDQVNETWKMLRRLSQEWHCLVIAPTQANAASYDVRTQSMKNFSEDKRKLAHVTGMLGLNQTEEEKAKSVMRLNWIVLRESPFHPNRCLWVGQCLQIGKAFYCATL